MKRKEISRARSMSGIRRLRRKNEKLLPECNSSFESDLDIYKNRKQYSLAQKNLTLKIIMVLKKNVSIKEYFL